MNTLSGARAYLARGWQPIPIPAGQKGPRIKGWQRLLLTADDLQGYFSNGTNIGLLLGEPSGGLQDVDLDCPEALAIATGVLPPTHLIHGRPEKPRSHRWYKADASARTVRFEDIDGTCLVELRGTGGQTVVPPSLHPSGEPFIWDEEGEPAPIKYADLLASVKQLAAIAILARHWPKKGTRDRAAMALAGFLLRGGLPPAEIERLITLVANTAGDEETLERMGTVVDTARKIVAGVPTTGGPTLSGLVGEKVVGKVQEWLDLKTNHGAWGSEPEHRTDLGNARRLVRRHGDDLRFCHAWSDWLVWDDRRWMRDDTGEVTRRAKDTVLSIYGEATSIQDEEIRKLLAKHAASSESKKRIHDMIALAQSEPEVPVCPAELDTDPWLLTVKNGTIDLRTGELLRHDRRNLITKIASVEYDPGAKFHLWDDFLARILPDPDLRAFVQRAAGYSLTGLTTEEVLFFAYGPTASGKSTFLESIRSTWGDYSARTDFETFLRREHVTGGPRNDIARLAGVRFVVSIEVESGRRLAESVVKSITGGDTISARFLHQEAFEFRPAMKLWLAANDRPTVRDDDAAMWRRILQIPFAVEIPPEERDPEVKSILTNAEIAGPAILAWAVQGCLAWQRDGLGVPPAVRAATAEYQAAMDPIADFAAECLEFDYAAIALSSDLWEAFVDFHDHRPPIKRKRFSQCLGRRGLEDFQEPSGRRRRCWRGVRLRSGIDDERIGTH